jgi:hypothetical protein
MKGTEGILSKHIFTNKDIFPFSPAQNLSFSLNSLANVSLFDDSQIFPTF